MLEPSALLPAAAPSAEVVPDVSLERVEQCPPSLWRRLYTEVGREYHWIDRLEWTDAEIARYLADPALEL